VKTRTVVPIQHPKTGEPIAAGAEIDLDDEQYQALRQAGAVEASEAEVKEHATPEAQGNYSARTGRAEAGGTDADDPKDEAPKEPKREKDKGKD
jgi:hypothetical protein